MVAELVCGEWRSGPVKLADSFGKRLLGIYGVPRRWGVLIPGRSVHGFFIIRSLWAVGLDGTRRVVGVRTLRPGGLAVFRGASSVLELPRERTPPPPGRVLAWQGGRSP